MEKKDILSVVIVFSLMSAFAIISFLLFLSRNSSKKLTAGKMKIGAIILTMTAVTTLNSSCKTQRTCYKTVPADSLSKNQTISNESNLNEDNNKLESPEYL